MRMISCIRVLCILCDRNLFLYLYQVVPNEISLIAELFFTLIRSGCATLSVCATLGASVPTYRTCNSYGSAVACAGI